MFGYLCELIEAFQGRIDAGQKKNLELRMRSLGR